MTVSLFLSARPLHTVIQRAATLINLSPTNFFDFVFESREILQSLDYLQPPCITRDPARNPVNKRLSLAGFSQVSRRRHRFFASVILLQGLTKYEAAFNPTRRSNIIFASRRYPEIRLTSSEEQLIRGISGRNANSSLFVGRS